MVLPADTSAAVALAGAAAGGLGVLAAAAAHLRLGRLRRALAATDRPAPADGNLQRRIGRQDDDYGKEGVGDVWLQRR